MSETRARLKAVKQSVALRQLTEAETVATLEKFGWSRVCAREWFQFVRASATPALEGR